MPGCFLNENYTFSTVVSCDFTWIKKVLNEEVLWLMSESVLSLRGPQMSYVYKIKK